MASSRKSNSSEFAQRCADKLARLIPAHSSILIGFSGGADSVVLLHLLHQFAPRFSWRLSALHVHHGISPRADAWAEFCGQRCAEYDIPFHLERVDIEPLREQGIEAAARQLRYGAYARYPCDFLALAHHADDQAETVMLQLLRGAGVRGASAMPELARRDVLWVRPLLNDTRAEIVAYAESQHLSWIEDASNADESYPRNFLRHRILPVLEERFPSYRQTLARSAQHFAEASILLDELALLDAANAISDEKLNVDALKNLSVARAKNLLRCFLHTRGAPVPQSVQLEDMVQQLRTAGDDAAVCVTYAGWQVRRYRGEVYALRALPDFDPKLQLHIHAQDTLRLVWPALGCTLGFTRTTGQGVSLAKLQSAPLTLRLRKGGEAIRPHVHAATRTLKNLLQEQHMPPWLRDRVPLLYCGEQLVCAMGVAIATDYQAGVDEIGVQMGLVEGYP